MVSPDGTTVIDFDDLVDGFKYHAVRKFDNQITRYQVDDENLEIESSRSLLDSVQSMYPNSHLHQNLKIFRGKNVVGQFDAIVHGHKSDSTIAILMEAKTKVHEKDFERVLEKVKSFEDFVSENATLKWSDSFDPLAKKGPFAHFSNVKYVIPCLAGKHFTTEHVDSCIKRGIIPIYPSGGRFAVKLLGLLKKAL